MENNKLVLTIGSLLHDIGKVVYRADVEPSRHAISGRNFLASDKVNITDKAVLDMVRYHHAADLKNASIAENSLAYIV